MIKEDYVSFETAKLLKEKGFDEQTRFAYTESGKADFSSLTRYWNQGSLYACPSQSMAMKWLREVYNIFIEISVSIDLNGKYHYSYFILDRECKYVRKGYTDFDWNYNQACEEAIKYCLENLVY